MAEVNMPYTSGTSIGTTVSITDGTYTVSCSSLTMYRSSPTATTNWYFSGTWTISKNGYSIGISTITLLSRDLNTIGTFTGSTMSSSVTFSSNNAGGSSYGYVYLQFKLSDTSEYRLRINVCKNSDITTIYLKNNSGSVGYIPYQSTTNFYLDPDITSAIGFGKKVSKYKTIFSDNYTNAINITSGSGYLNTITAYNPNNIKFQNKISGRGNITVTATIYIYDSNSTQLDSSSKYIIVYGSTDNAKWGSVTFDPDAFLENVPTSTNLIIGQYLPASGTGSADFYFAFTAINGSTTVPTSDFNIKSGSTTLNFNTKYSISTYFDRSDSSMTLRNPFTITSSFPSTFNGSLNITLYNSSNTAIYGVGVHISLSGSAKVLTSIKTDYFKYTPKQLVFSGKTSYAVIYQDPGYKCGLQKVQVWPPIYDVTLGDLNKISSSKIKFTANINRYDGPIIVDNTSYTYLRSSAIILTRGTGNFPTSTLNSTVNFSTSNYSNLNFGNNTSTYALYSNNDSYTLFLTTASSGTTRIPDNNYNYTSTNSTLSPSTFGYYFYGYFTLPNTYAFGPGTGGIRNYTGTNLVDWKSSSYTSRYRFSGFSGLKGWYTTREPNKWKLSRSDFNSSANYVELTASYDYYRTLWKPLNGSIGKEYIILSTSSTMIIGAGGGSGDDISVSNQSIYSAEQWYGDVWYGDLGGSNPTAEESTGEGYALTNNSGTSASIPHWYKSGSSIYLYLGDYTYSSGTNWIGTTILTGTPSVYFYIMDRVWTNTYQVQISCSSDSRTSMTQENTSYNSRIVYVYHFGAISSGSQVRFFAERMGYFYLDYRTPSQWKYTVHHTS
jgi:hypothetical protein